MDALKKVFEDVIGQFVCFDQDAFRGQCTRLPKYLMEKCGCPWEGAQTGNGCNLVDNLVKVQGGYYMSEEESQAKGYRVCSCDIPGSTYGHTWVELFLDGTWVLYEQNVAREGTVTANFGHGTVYSVSKGYNRGSWRNNVRYAGHRSIDAVIEANTPKPEPKPEPVPEPEPTPEPEPKFKEGDIVRPLKLVDYDGTPLKQYDDQYTIIQINGDRAVLAAPRGEEMQIWAAMNTNDIEKVE